MLFSGWLFFMHPCQRVYFCRICLVLFAIFCFKTFRLLYFVILAFFSPPSLISFFFSFSWRSCLFHQTSFFSGFSRRLKIIWKAIRIFDDASMTHLSIMFIFWNFLKLPISSSTLWNLNRSTIRKWISNRTKNAPTCWTQDVRSLYLSVFLYVCLVFVH